VHTNFSQVAGESHHGAGQCISDKSTRGSEIPPVSKLDASWDISSNNTNAEIEKGQNDNRDRVRELELFVSKFHQITFKRIERSIFKLVTIENDSWALDKRFGGSKIAF
jgi:hypothetical protein